MKVLHVYNRHRGGGGSDNAWDATIRLSIERGLNVGIFARDSKDLSLGIRGKVQALFSGIYAREAVQAFDDMLTEFKPDIVHAHELYPLISPWILPKCTRVGVPVVVTCYDYRLTCPVATHFSKGSFCDRCLGGHEYWAVLRNCRNSVPESFAFALRNAVTRKFGLFTSHVSCFVVLTDFGRRWLRDVVKIPENRIRVNPCAIHLPETTVDPSQGRYIAFAGRFVPEKGVEVLLEATRRTRLPLNLAGISLNPPVVREGDPVKIIAARSPDELAAFYRGARMLVVPSIWNEPFAIVGAESMSHGVPVVASRMGGLQDTVADGVSGLFFENNNVDDLAEKIDKLWHDDALCRRLGAGARQRVEEEYTEDAHFRRLQKIYEHAQKHPAVC